MFKWMKKIKRRKIFPMRENCMKFKFQWPSIKFYWHTATASHSPTSRGSFRTVTAESLRKLKTFISYPVTG